MTLTHYNPFYHVAHTKLQMTSIPLDFIGYRGEKFTEGQGFHVSYSLIKIEIIILAIHYAE